MAEKDGRGNCATCGALCCRYITVEMDEPARNVDVDEIRWFLAHEDVEVFIEDKRWYVQVRTKCKHLTANNRCDVYGDRFDVCRQHGPEECEASDGQTDAIEFHTTAEFDAYWARKKAKRKGRK